MIAAAAGLVGGVLCFFLWMVGLFILGAFMLVAISLAVLGVIDVNPPDWVQWVVVAVAAAIGGILALLLQKPVVIVATSFNGAFSVLSGVAFFLKEDYSTALEQLRTYILALMFAS